MQTICTAGFNRMRDRWDEMFDTNLCLAYAKQLPDHMTAFFEEVYQESSQRRERFVAKIAELRQEALDLQRLLGEQQQGLPAGIESRPLFDQRSTLDASLEQMQQKLSQRYEIIDEYLLEMETLCEGNVRGGPVSLRMELNGNVECSHLRYRTPSSWSLPQSCTSASVPLAVSIFSLYSGEPYLRLTRFS
uniref:Uncharacterized protein n=1 Tax=Anopheles coluzzii TaxID=1518534 RepID=A0A8W7PCE8_ANOCL